MARAIALRADFDAPSLCRLARRSKEAAQSRRLLALAAIYEDTSNNPDFSVVRERRGADCRAAAADGADFSGIRR